jgi:RHS repeat-associated protein
MALSILFLVYPLTNAQGDVDLYTGTSAHTFPIVTPPGTNGMGPTLALQYNSGYSDGWLGFGWGLVGLGYVERHGPNDGPVPDYVDGTDTFVLNLNGSQKLVYTGIDPGTGAAGQYYRTQIDNFMRIQLVGSWQTDAYYWVATDKNGTKYFFGQTSASRAYQPGPYNFRWYLDKVEDVHGVSWTVSYGQTNSAELYPNTIAYSQATGLTCTPSALTSCRTVEFKYKTRTGDVTHSYNTGGRVRLDWLLDYIDVKLGGQLVRRYKLGHTLTSPNPTRGNAVANRLTTITEYGADGTTSLPPTQFKYHVDEAYSSTLGLGHINLTGDDQTYFYALGGPFTGSRYSLRECTFLVDMNNDGLPDVLTGSIDTVNGGRRGYFSYFENQGDNSFGTSKWLFVDAAGDWNAAQNLLPSLCNTRTEKKTRRVHEGPRLHGFSAQIHRSYTVSTETVYNVQDSAVVDLNGDGLPDVLSNPSSGAEAGKWFWWRNKGRNAQNNGDALTDRAELTNPPPVSLNSPVDSNDLNEVTLADMNADGLVDIVRMTRTGVSSSGSFGDILGTWTLTWYRNQGNGAFANGVTHTLNTHTTYPNGSAASCIASTFVCAAFAKFYKPQMPGDVALIDMNNDGLPDFVFLSRHPANGGKIVVQYWPNQGSLGFGGQTVVTEGASTSPLYLPYDTTDTQYVPGLKEYHRFVDINGDGLVDILVGVGGAYRYFAGTPREGNFEATRSLTTNVPAVTLTRDNYMALGDIDGDGFTDVVLGNDRAYSYYRLSMENNHAHLQSVTNPLGGISEFSYYTRLRSGNTMRWVAGQERTKDGLETVNPTTYRTYAFKNGLYVGWPQNEFRGYGEVTASDSLTHTTVTTFNQNEYLKGLVKTVTETSTDSVGPFSKTTTFGYDIKLRDPNVYRIFLHSVETTGAAVAKTTFGTYDDFGNVTTATFWSQAGTTTLTDTYNWSYEYNKSAYVVNKPYSISHANGSNPAVAGWTFLEYDNQAYRIAPTKGDLTKETRWQYSASVWNGENNPVFQYSYDTYGNRAGTLDANGSACATTNLTSKTVFDIPYQTFPISITNAQCQVSNTTYWGINNTALTTGFVTGSYTTPGLVASVTEANNVRTDRYWDGLGWPQALVVPPDTTAKPTTNWSYGITGTAPSYVTEAKRENAATGVLATTTFLDGLGRKIQTKSEGANTGEQVTQDTWYSTQKPVSAVAAVSIPYIVLNSAFTPRDIAKPRSTMTYDDAGRVLRAIFPDSSSNVWNYHGFGAPSREVTSTDRNGKAVKRFFDDKRRLIKVVEPVGGGTTQYSYDSYGTSTNGINGHRELILDAAGNGQFFDFDTLGRKRYHYDPDLGLWSYTYDANGNLLTQTDAKGQIISFTYDKLNRPLTQVYPDASVVNYEYDDATAGANRKGRLWKVTDLSGSTTFTYNGRGRTTQVTKTVGGVATNLAQNPGFENGTTWPTTWVQDAHGGSAAFNWDNTTRKSGGRSVSIANATVGATVSHPAIAYASTKVYTANAWIKTRGLSAAAARIEFNFYSSTWGWLGYRSSSAVGGTTDWTLVSVTAAAGGAPAGTAYIDVVMVLDTATGTAWYDAVNWVNGSVASTATTYTTKATWDSMDRLVDLTYPDGEVVSHTYNWQGLLSKLRSTTNAMDYVTALNYNALNQTTAKTSGNGKVTSYDYYDASAEGGLSFRLRNLATPGVQNLTYVYDNIGNVIYMVDSLKAATQNFGYDDLHRLNYASSVALPAYTYGYTYDTVGTLTSGENRGFQFAPPGSPRPHAPVGYADGSCSFGYDNNGNLGTRACGTSVRTFTWNYDNRLTEVKDGTAVRGTYTYDYAGNRVKKVEGSATTVVPFPHYRTINGAKTKYYYANGQRVAERDSANAVFYYHGDHLGGSNVVTNSAGAEVKATLFYPYGATRTETGSKTIAHKYTGQEQDVATGLYYYGARYYDPAIMRFISPDSVVPDTADPQVFNRYAYVKNNPVRYVDPTGHVSEPTLYNRTADQYNFTATLGLGMTFIKDIYGNVYFGPAASTDPGISLTASWLNQPFRPDPGLLLDFNQGPSFEVAGSVGVVTASESMSPGTGTATNIGITTPSLGVTGTYSYTWRILRAPPNHVLSAKGVIRRWEEGKHRGSSYEGTMAAGDRILYNFGGSSDREEGERRTSSATSTLESTCCGSVDLARATFQLLISSSSTSSTSSSSSSSSVTTTTSSDDSGGEWTCDFGGACEP